MAVCVKNKSVGFNRYLIENQHFRCLSGWRDSNSRPPAPKAGALTGLRYTPSALLNCGAKLQLIFLCAKKIV